MKRIWIAIAAAFGLLASAQFSQANDGYGGAPVAALPGPETIVGDSGVEHRYGVLPWLRRNLSLKSIGGCNGCGVGHHGGGAVQLPPPGAGVPGYPQPGQPGMGMPGTLVFPQHPFVRSPRDFFMWEK